MNILKMNVNFLMIVFVAVMLGTVSCAKDDDKDFDPKGTYSGTINTPNEIPVDFTATVENTTIKFTSPLTIDAEIIGTLDSNNEFVATGIEDDGSYIKVTVTLTGSIDQSGVISGTKEGSDYMYSEEREYTYTPGTFSGQKQ